MISQRIRRQNSLIMTVVVVTIATVVAAIVYLIWQLATTVDLS